MDALLRLMANHRSVRSYLPERLEDGLVRECVAAAQMAATSSNVQPYSVIRIEDSETRRALAACCGGQAQISEAGAFFVLCAEQRRFRKLAQDLGEDFSPNLETFLVGAIDTALFAQNLVLAFESKGLGTCYIGGLRNDLPEVKRLLALPEDVFPLFGLCAGRAAQTPDPKPRLALEGVLFSERYPGEDEQGQHIAEYDGRMGDYYAARDLAGRNWSGAMVRKWRKPTRSYLHEFYSGQGANLS